MGSGPATDPYRRPFEAILDAAVVLDATTGLILAANQAATNIFGFGSPNEMVGLNPLDYVAEEDRKPIALLLAQGLQVDRPIPAEIRMKTKDGRAIWVSATSTPIEHEGKKASLTAIREITSEKATDAALREAEHRYERLFDGMLDGAVVLDVSTFEIALANRAAAEMIGFDSPREVIGLNPLTFIPEEDRDQVARMIALNLEGKGPNPAEIRLAGRDKREIWVSATASKIEYEGRTATLATLRDITADKAKDAALQAAEESKLRLIDAAAESIFVVQDWKMVYVNPAGAAAAGLPQKDMIGLSFRDFVHPDQREALTERHEKLLAGQRFSDFTTVKGIDAKGETRWAEIREIPYSWQGRPAVMSLAHDITDRMRADEERKEREERLRAVIENAWDGITILDENYNVIFESPSLARISGYTPEEWMGRPVGQMNIHPDDLAPLLAKIEALKSQPGSIVTDVKIRYQHKDGSRRWIEATGRNLLHDPKVKGLVVNFRDITENVRADEERRASEERFRTLIEKATDVVIVLDATGKITYQSPSLERVTGFGHDEWVGRPLDQLLIHPDDLPSLATLLERVLTQPGATFEGVTARYQHKDGSWHTLEATVTNMLHDPNVNGLVANFRDITERKLAEEALRASEERNRLLVENASEVIAVIQDSLLKFINAKVTDFVGYLPEELVSRSFVELIHPDDRQMVADNYARRLRGEKLPNTYQFRVTHKNGDVRWAEISVALFEWQEQPATLALLNDITERKKAEEALREAKEYAENVIETANVLAVMLDTEGKVTLLNEAGEKITGYKRDEVLGKNWFELVVPKERYPNVWEEFSKMKAAGKIVGTFENPILTKSGEERIISWKNSTLITGDKVVGTLSFGTDITERKMAEEALRQSEAKYRRLFESTQTAMEVINMETGLVALANEATARMFGFASADELVGENSTKYLRPEDVSWVAEKMAQAVTDSSWREIAELQVRTKDGRWVWISGMVRQSEYLGKPALLVSLLDITSRKQAELTLQESEEKYRLLTEKTNDVIYTIDLDFNNTYVSPSVERILGFKPEEYLGRSPDQRMTLESLARAQEALLEHLSLDKDPRADPNRTVRIELEFYRKDGSTVWLEHQVSGLRDANGTAVGLHGVARDVTERRKAEQALRDSEAIYKRLFENTQTAMEVVSGETGLVVLANETTARMFGFDSAEDLVGVDSMEYLLPEDRDRVAAEMAQAIANKDHSGATELSVRTKDGRLLWINALVTYTEYAGKTSLLISLIDLTSRKRAEEKLKASEEKYRLLTEKTNDMIWTTDMNLRVTYVSPSVGRILGFTPEEHLKRDLSQQITPESLARANETLLAQLALEHDPNTDPQRTVLLELEYYQKNGSVVWLENRISGIRDANGGLIGLHGVARDVTERRRAEEALRERLKELQCIAAISRLAEKPELPVEDFVREAVGLLPNAWQYPEICGARIMLDSKEFKTANYRETEWSQSADIVVDQKRFGTVTVCYLQEMPEADQGPFLKEEGTLIDTIADFLGHVIQHRQMEQHLGASEERYRLLAQNASDIIWVIDANLKITYISPSAASLLGYSVEELMTGSFESALTPESLAAVAKVYMDDMATEATTQGSTGQRLVEIEVVCKDGSTVWLEAVTNPTRDGDGRLSGFQGACRDITKRRRAQEALATSETNYRNLFDQTLLGTEVVDGQTGKVLLANHAIARMFGFSSPEEMIGLDAITGWVMPEDMEWVLREFAKAVADPDKRDVATLRVKGKDGRMVWVSGSGTLFDYEGRPAILISLIDVTAAKEAEDRLRESEEKNRLLIDNAAEGIIVVQDGVTRFSNRRCTEVTGRSPEELLAGSFLDIVHPEDREMVALNYMKRVAGEDVPNNYQFRTIDKEGNTKWLQVNAVRLTWEGRPATLTMLSDVTDRVKAEQALRDSEERFRALVEKATDAVAVLDAAGNVLYYTPSMDRVTGYKAGEWVNKSLSDLLLHPDDLPKLASVLEQVLKEPGASVENFTTRYQHRDGTWHVLEATARNMLHDPKIGGVVANFRDITERVKAEEKLKESEERYRLLAENAADVIWVADLNLRITYASPAVTRLLGYTIEEVTDGSFLNRALTPDSLSSMAHVFTDDLGAEQIKAGTWKPRAVEIEVVSKDGLKYWLEAAISDIRDTEGRLIAFQGACRNITDRKKTEVLLRASEERFRGLVETTSDWVWEIDRNSRYTYVSPRVRDVLGYEPEEVLGHTPFQFMHQREGRRVSKIVRRFAAEQLPFSLMENTCIHKDGHSVVMETSAVPIIGSDGSFLGYRGIDRDITERKKAEQELQRSLKRLEKTMESTIEAITTTIETRDPYTTGHQMRVTDLACAIAKVMEVPPKQIEGIRVAGLLHDIGKIAIPTEILSKPGKLNDVEYEMIKTHSKVGYNILKKIEFPWPVARAVLQHHERWNGSGYPHGIRGEDILLEARILAVADVMEAMSSHRPYRPTVGADKALEEITRNSGILYDPAVADACITAFTQAGFKFAPSLPGAAVESEITSASHPVDYLDDQ